MAQLPKQSCDDDRLTVLIRSDEESKEFLEAALHVESCADCQRRLEELAADADSWHEASELLRSRRELDAEFRQKGQPPSALGELLEPPSHPEMLGRLGRYEIEGVIGSGGMGVVLMAHDSDLNRPVAIKVLAPHMAHSGPARQRFAREGRAAAAVMNEHVVAIYNVESDSRVPYLVMQYVPGRSLQSRVDEDGPLDAKAVLRIGIHAAGGLAAAHAQGLVHRDVKPANLLLENGVERALLTDFGLARVVDDVTLTHTGIVAGTPHYMSPEQADGQVIDHRSDLFSLGAVLYFAVTGRPPFRAERPMAVLRHICDKKHRPIWELNPDVPESLCEIIDRLLEKRPGRRFANAAQAEAALSAALLGLQRPTSCHTRNRLYRRLRQHAVVLGAVAVLSALFIASAIALLGPIPSGAVVAPERDQTQPSQAAFAVEQLTADNFAAETSNLSQQLDKLEGIQGPEFWLPSDQWYREVQQIKDTLSALESQVGELDEHE